MNTIETLQEENACLKRNAEWYEKQLAAAQKAIAQKFLPIPTFEEDLSDDADYFSYAGLAAMYCDVLDKNRALQRDYALVSRALSQRFLLEDRTLSKTEIQRMTDTIRLSSELARVTERLRGVEKELVLCKGESMSACLPLAPVVATTLS